MLFAACQTMLTFKNQPLNTLFHLFSFHGMIICRGLKALAFLRTVNCKHCAWTLKLNVWIQYSKKKNPCSAFILQIGLCCSLAALNFVVIVTLCVHCRWVLFFHHISMSTLFRSNISWWALYEVYSELKSLVPSLWCLQQSGTKP